MAVKCIIFDCDGVLVDTEEVSFRVFNEMVTELGMIIPIDKMKVDLSGTSLGACIDFAEKHTGLKVPDDFISNYRIRSFEAFKTEVKAIEGVHELLPQIKLPYCVASSGNKPKIILNLTTTKLIDFFGERIFSAYEIKKWKPDPGIFLHAAKEMGFEPADCLVIEDSKAGITGAKAGGFQVIGYAPNEARAAILEPFDVPIINDILEVTEYI